MIPGAIKTDGTPVGHSQCGTKGGLATAGGTSAAKKTVCCKYLFASY